MEDWIALSSLVAFLGSSDEVEEMIRENQIRMRGEYCPDYTGETSEWRSDSEEIPRLFILNSDFLFEHDRLIAHPDYGVHMGDTNFSMYSFVRVCLQDLACARTKKLLGQRGRKTVHDWDAIFAIALVEIEGWTESQNKFIEHVRNEFRLEHPGFPLPDQSTLKKRLSTFFKQRTRSTGA